MVAKKLSYKLFRSDKKGERNNLVYKTFVIILDILNKY